MPRDDAPAKYRNAEPPLPGETLTTTRDAQILRAWLQAPAHGEERRRLVAVRNWLRAHARRWEMP
jgi:hypothetical protein